MRLFTMIAATIMCVVMIYFTLVQTTIAQASSSLFEDEKFTNNDAVLVTDQADHILFDWQANQALIPASLTKLVTSQLAIEKWGLEHKFVTDFFMLDRALWVKGYGDPLLVSQELDRVVDALRKAGVSDSLDSINIDTSYFDIGTVPGRTHVADPYNAPLSAVAANFNTAMLRRRQGVVESAESQTPLTPTANGVSHLLTAKTERVNLVNADNAQTNFAELLMAKMGFVKSANEAIKININQTLPTPARLIYRHRNSHTLADVLRGTLEFSNNFMANQVFLKLADQTDAASVAAKPEPVSFERAAEFVGKQLAKRFEWSSYTITEGAGLSRSNRLSAYQINDVLKSLAPNKMLLKPYVIKSSTAEVFAKTGTLDGVRTFAGYISVNSNNYRFVFMFNRPVKWRYREQMLERLVNELG